MATAAEEMSLPELKVMLGGAEVLNSKPAGAFRMSVSPEPEPISLLFPSLITIGPRVVQAGRVALAALSARILVPPVAGVSATVANALVPCNVTYTTEIQKRM